MSHHLLLNHYPPTRGNKLFADLQDIWDEDLKIVFASQFSSGKSTLLNGLLQVDLLPMDDFPETGVATYIHKGSPEAGTYRTEDGRVESFDPAELSKVTSLFDEDGNRRSEVTEILAVDLTLNSSNLLSKAVWIDSPGISDEEILNERALETIRHSDIVFWVMSSRSFLSMTDRNFLREILDKHDVAGLVLVINVFMNNPSQESWQQYLDTDYRRSMNRLKETIRDMGLSDDRIPLLVPVNAHMIREDRNGYGYPEFTNLLGKLCSLNAGEVTMVREKKTHDMLLYQFTDVRDARDKMLQKHTAINREVSQRMNKLLDVKSRVSSLINRYCDDLVNQVDNAAGAIASPIYGSNLKRGNHYSNELNSQIRSIHERLFSIFVGDLNINLSNTIGREIDSNMISTLNSQSKPKSVSVLVPDYAIDESIKTEKAAKWGAASGAGGLFLSGPFAIVTAAIGAGAGYIADESEAKEDKLRSDANETDRRVRQEGKNAVRFLIASDNENNIRNQMITEIVNWVDSQLPNPKTVSRSESKKLNQYQ